MDPSLFHYYLYSKPPRQADRAALEAEVVSLRQLHGQVEVTKQQYEAQMREAATLQEQLKKQMEEKSALQTEVKKMRALERELGELKAAGRDAQAMEEVRTLVSYVLSDLFFFFFCF